MCIMFIAKIFDKALNTCKTIFVQKSKWLLAGLSVMLSEFICYCITKSIVTSDTYSTMIFVSIASGIGCSLACIFNEKLSRERTFINVIMSDNLDEMKMLRDFLAENHITNVATDSYTLDWNTKTISITAYSETKAESKMIDNYILSRPIKFKRRVT